MSTGQWASFTMGGLTASLLSAGSDNRSITEYAARGHWDPVHRKIQFWGQGHYAAEKLVTWDDATNQWSLGAPAGSGGIGHAYYHLALDPATGDLYLHGYYTNNVKKKAYGGGWTSIANAPNSPEQITGGLEWMATLNGGAGGLVYSDPRGVWTWNPVANAWTTRSSLSGLGGYHTWTVAAGGYVYFGGGLEPGSTKMYRIDSSGTVTTAPSSPIVAGISSGIVLRHPDGNQLLLFAPGLTGAIYRFNGSSWVSHGSHQIGGENHYWFGVPIRDYGIIVFISQFGGADQPIVKVYKP